MEIKTAKIVGAINSKSWSQVHVFEPKDEKLESHGVLVAAMGFKALQEDLQVSSFGKELITRLQEMYYSNESESVFKKVSQTIESLAAEFMTQVELKVVIGVVWTKQEKMFLYVGRLGGGQAFLVREGAMVALLSGETEQKKVVSGRLESGDKLVVGTSQFYRIVSEEKLRSSTTKKEAQEIVDELAPIVQGHENNSRAAAVVLKVLGEALGLAGTSQETMDDQGELPDLESVQSESSDSKSKESLGEKVGMMLMVFQKKVRRLLKKETRSEVFIRSRGGGKSQRSAATVGLVLVLIFGMSLVVAGRKRQREKRETEYIKVVEEVDYKYEEAKSLMELNPLRAKSLLSDIKLKIEEYKTSQEGELSEELTRYLNLIETALNEVQKEYKEETATEWFDFSLVKEGFKGSDWEVEENKVWVLDETSKTVVEVDLKSKASRVVVGGSDLKEGKMVGLAGNRGFVASEGLISVIDGEEEKVIDEIGEDGWSNPFDLVGFSSNLYVLDQDKEGQIYKYLGVTSGLSAQRDYLNGDSYDLSEAVSLAIDGSVWVLFSDGTMVKYTRGEKDAFVVTGLDRDFERPVKLFTSPEVENLYVLDQKQTRVVVISKSGDYVSQYVWPGMAGVKDLIVLEEEGKMFLLTGEKVFTLELKD